jgi:hypothetical protein
MLYAAPCRDRSAHGSSQRPEGQQAAKERGKPVCRNDRRRGVLCAGIFAVVKFASFVEVTAISLPGRLSSNEMRLVLEWSAGRARIVPATEILLELGVFADRITRNYYAVAARSAGQLFGLAVWRSDSLAIDNLELIVAPNVRVRGHYGCAKPNHG